MTSKEANQEVEIARCHRGQYFGELALVTNKPRAASAYAVGEVKCLGKQLVCVSSHPFVFFACLMDHAWVSSHSKPSNLLVAGSQIPEAGSMGWRGAPDGSWRSTAASSWLIFCFLCVWPVLVCHTVFRSCFNTTMECICLLCLSLRSGLYYISLFHQITVQREIRNMISVSVVSFEVSALSGLNWRSVFWVQKTDWYLVSFLTNSLVFISVPLQSWMCKHLRGCLDPAWTLWRGI